jgi:2-polyprenyl-6-hydroxyphenyl methylase/3-demethylubiquinone-9 3-methyltransferase
MFYFLAVPFALQGLAILVDEFYFHRRRGLPIWERWGHPLDTLSLLSCWLFLLCLPYSATSGIVFVFLAVGSCLLVTKDEVIHHKVCCAGEAWLHAVLFLLHPIVLISSGLVWIFHEQNPWNYSMDKEWLLLQVQSVLTFLFLIYQGVYWLGFRKDKMAPKSEDVNNEYYHTLGERWYKAFDDPVALLRIETQVKNPWVLKRIQQRHKDLSGLKLLDVGCGAGFLSNYMAKQGLDVTGLDLSMESLDVAKSFDSTKSAHYVRGNAESLPFESGSFDAVTAMDFLEHVDDPEKVVAEISRVLKPGGIFFYHTFNRNWLAYLLVIKAVEFLVKNTPPNLHVYKLFIKPTELADFCKKNQMQVSEVTGIRPRFSTITWSSLRTGIVPKGLEFQLTRSQLISYLGMAIKSSKQPS